ncbi:MAG: hypothetical protein JRD68_05705, partial [Deltaproteobacteria bacterium]|nr:hypothetical protein [Deltaproteobacteria bacterium]
MNSQRNNKQMGKRLTTQSLTNMAFAHKQSGTLIAAIELDLFNQVSKGAATVPEVAKALNLTEDRADKLVTACAALGLLEKRGGSYYNSPEVDRYLIRDRPKYIGDWYVHQFKSEYDNWKDAAAAIRKPPSPTGMYQTMMHGNAETIRAFTVAGYNSSIAAGHKLARDFDFSPFFLFLDLGGGSGCYSIPAVQGNPNLRAIVFDFPLVCAVTEEFIAQAGLSDRMTTQTGDFMVDELPAGADLVSIIGNLHAYTLEETEFLIDKAFQAISPGGSMIIIDYMLNEEKTGPLEAALYHLMSATRGNKGWVKSVAEVSEFMSQAGAVDIDIHEFIPG